MEFLVEFEISVPEGTPKTEVTAREDAESAAAAKLVDQGHLVRLWTRRARPGESRPIGLYRAESGDELDGLLRALPHYEWMRVTVTPLDPHRNDPAVHRPRRGRQEPIVSSRLPEPRLTKVYRLDATLAPPLELGETEDVDPSEYTFRTSTEIETAAPDLDWLNKGVFISVGGRQAAGVIYETYLVG